MADRFFGRGWAAIVVSTLLVLMFGEILPQALCTKYALPVGGRAVWVVKLSMFCLYPIAYPAARLLERLLGSSPEGRLVYRRAELKELVSIMGGRIELAPDEVKIIRGVLDLRDKHPALIMTPLDEVFMLQDRDQIDVRAAEEILQRGFSRIPVYSDNNRQKIIGMLLVKRLLASNISEPITVASLPLSPLHTVGHSQSLFTILHDFQQGQSHLAVVLGEHGRPIGIITLEDIIEEMIQDEIVDETDSQHQGVFPSSFLDLLRYREARHRSKT